MFNKKQLTKKRYKKGNTIAVEKEREMIVTAESSFHIKEAYKAARTNTMFSLAGQGCKKVIVTSSFPGEGKSTTCLNMAITFAQTGAKVLILDADLRKPTVHRKLDIANAKGLSHLISGFCTLEEAIIPTSNENLDIITAGHIPPNPAELLASDSMGDILEKLGEKYDYLFIDTPPLNVVTDATVLSGKVSGTIVVVRQEITHHKDLQEALGKLEFVGAKILGVILHDVKSQKNGRYGKYGKYSKYSRYSQYGYRNTADTEYGM